MSIAPPSQRHFSSLARRLGRIFAHAFYHHREAFEQAEAESSLYERFLALTSKFKLVPSEFLVIPPRMQAFHDGQERERGREDEPHSEPDVQETQELAEESDDRQWGTMQSSSSAVGLNVNAGRGDSPPGSEGPARNPSPRKGRSRTDTMVHSDVANVVEELAKSEGFSEADLDRAIAQERLLATVEQGFPEPSSDGSEPFASLGRQATIKFPEGESLRDQSLKILLKQLDESEPEPESVTTGEDSKVEAQPPEPEETLDNVPVAVLSEEPLQEEEVSAVAGQSQDLEEDVEPLASLAPETEPIPPPDAAEEPSASFPEPSPEVVAPPSTLATSEQPEDTEPADDTSLLAAKEDPEELPEEVEPKASVPEAIHVTIEVSEADASSPQETEAVALPEEPSQPATEDTEPAEKPEESEESPQDPEPSES